MSESKLDYKVGRLGLMKYQGARSVVTPVPKVHDLGRLHRCPTAPGRLQDNKSVAVEEICMFSKHLVELRNHRMVFGNGLSVELAER